MILVEGKVFIFADTTVNFNPDAEQLAEIALVAATVARHFNLDPIVGMLSFSNFGDNDRPESRKVRDAVRILNEKHPDLQVDGEMQADVAVLPQLCQRSGISLCGGGRDVEQLRYLRNSECGSGEQMVCQTQELNWSAILGQALFPGSLQVL